MSDFADACCGIQQLHARFTDAAWRQDADDFSGCFAPHGEWKIAGVRFVGRERIVEACGSLLGKCQRIQLLSTPPLLEVDGDHALGRLHMVEFAKMADGSAAMTIGIYHDRYVRLEDRWYFASRFWSLQYRGPADLSSAFVDAKDFGRFPNMPAPDEPSVARPPVVP